MIVSYLLAMSMATAAVHNKCPVIVGKYTLGFEASYIIPNKAPYAGRKIWIESPKMLDDHFKKNDSHKMWRNAEVKLRGCVKTGKFGPLGFYRLSIESFDLIAFKVAQ